MDNQSDSWRRKAFWETWCSMTSFICSFSQTGYWDMEPITGLNRIFCVSKPHISQALAHWMTCWPISCQLIGFDWLTTADGLPGWGGGGAALLLDMKQEQKLSKISAEVWLGRPFPAFVDFSSSSSQIKHVSRGAQIGSQSSSSSSFFFFFFSLLDVLMFPRTITERLFPQSCQLECKAHTIYITSLQWAR